MSEQFEFADLVEIQVVHADRGFVWMRAFFIGYEGEYPSVLFPDDTKLIFIKTQKIRLLLRADERPHGTVKHADIWTRKPKTED